MDDGTGTTMLVQLIERLATMPMAVLLLLVIVGGYREWWVYGTTHRALRADRDEWRRIAMESTGLVRVATRVLQPPPPTDDGRY